MKIARRNISSIKYNLNIFYSNLQDHLQWDSNSYLTIIIAWKTRKSFNRIKEKGHPAQVNTVYNIICHKNFNFKWRTLAATYAT